MVTDNSLRCKLYRYIIKEEINIDLSLKFFIKLSGVMYILKRQKQCVYIAHFSTIFKIYYRIIWHVINTSNCSWEQDRKLDRLIDLRQRILIKVKLQKVKTNMFKKV